MARPTVTPTSGIDLGVAALAGGLGAWMLVRTLERLNGDTPDLPWFAVALVGALAVIMGVFALRAPRRSEESFEPGDPGPALARIALGKAALLGGTTLAAGYLVFAYLFVDHLDVPALRDRVIRGVVTAVLAGGVAGAGWLLERRCRGAWNRGDPGDAPDSDRD